jgi:hypothetical protein
MTGRTLLATGRTRKKNEKPERGVKVSAASRRLVQKAVLAGVVVVSASVLILSASAGGVSASVLGASEGSPKPAVQTGAHIKAGLFTTYFRTATGRGDFAGAFPACDPGDVVTGGGGTHIGGTRPNAMVASRPEGFPATGWGTRYIGGDSSTRIAAYVICAHITP